MRCDPLRGLPMSAQREFLKRQTAMRLRPLARRRLSTLRPPSVLMRDRNPCTFLRRRLWGWKVRFIDQPFEGAPPEGAERHSEYVFASNPDCFLGSAENRFGAARVKEIEARRCPFGLAAPIRCRSRASTPADAVNNSNTNALRVLAQIVDKRGQTCLKETASGDSNT